MTIGLSTKNQLSSEDQEVLERVRELVRKVARMPDLVMPCEQGRLLLQGLPTAKYRRISKHRSDAYGQVSQDEDILLACETEGFEIPLLDYEDHITASGRLIRWDFERMLADARAGKFKVLIVGRVDRFARNLLEGQLYLFELRLLGVYVYFCDEGVIAGLDPNWREIVERKLNDAQGHLRVITANNKKTAATRRRQGKWTGPAPFGWQISSDRRALVQHPTEWPIVQRVIELLRADEKSLYGICDQLWDEGVRGRHGRRIQKSQIWSALKHPILKGCWPLYAPGSRYKGGPGYREIKKAEGPLTEAEFNELGEIMAGRHRRHQKVERVTTDYALRNLLRCGTIIPEVKSETGEVLAPARRCGVEFGARCVSRSDSAMSGAVPWIGPRTKQKYMNYRHHAYQGCSPDDRGWMVSEIHLLAQLTRLFEQMRLPDDATRVISEYLSGSAQTAKVDRAILLKRFRAEQERLAEGLKFGLYGEDPAVAIPLWQTDNKRVLAKIAQLPPEVRVPKPHEIQKLVDLPEMWAAANSRKRRLLLRALFTGIYLVRDDDSSSKRRIDGKKQVAPRIRGRARIAALEPRPEYAELVAYAFSGSCQSGNRQSDMVHKTTFGEVAGRFLRWLSVEWGRRSDNLEEAA